MKCCLCEGEIEVQAGGWDQGHNPEPVSIEEGAKCCGMCNTMKVIPARLAELGTRELGRALNSSEASVSEIVGFLERRLGHGHNG